MPLCYNYNIIGFQCVALKGWSYLLGAYELSSLIYYTYDLQNWLWFSKALAISNLIPRNDNSTQYVLFLLQSRRPAIDQCFLWLKRLWQRRTDAQTSKLMFSVQSTDRSKVPDRVWYRDHSIFITRRWKVAIFCIPWRSCLAWPFWDRLSVSACELLIRPAIIEIDLPESPLFSS